MKQHFINELDSLRTQITAQGELAERAIHNAIQAFSTGDTELARRVMAHDEIIDREEIRLEEECLKVLALYQPVAGDLRTVISCIKINTALERIADFGSHIAAPVQAALLLPDSCPSSYPCPLHFTSYKRDLIRIFTNCLPILTYTRADNSIRAGDFMLALYTGTVFNICA